MTTILVIGGGIASVSAEMMTAIKADFGEDIKIISPEEAMEMRDLSVPQRETLIMKFEMIPKKQLVYYPKIKKYNEQARLRKRHQWKNHR